MTGLLLYAFTVGGLGLLLPPVRLDGITFTGLRLFGGFCLFILGFPLLHLFLGLSLNASAWTLLGLAAVGMALALRRMLGDPPAISGILHPATVLLGLGIAAVAVYGTPDYLPYTSDEFSNWLGAARHIFMVGDYNTIRESIALPGYAPGWRLALLYPWMFTGRIDEGASAAIPFVAHVGLLGLVFDVARRAISATGRFSDRRAALFAWAFLGVVMAGEASGLLWTRTLLVEPPQVYTLSATIIVMVLAASQDQVRGPLAARLAAYAGLFLATAYIIKVAAITLIPAMVVAAAAVYMGGRASRPDALKRSVLLLALMVVPMIAAAGLWKLTAPDIGSVLSSPSALFSGQSMQRVAERDWLELGGRFGAAVWSYVASYKTPLTLVAILALAYSAAKGRYQALLIWGVFAVVYTASLYWWHLAGASDYYYQRLASIERFMRIPIRTLHLLGLMAVALEASAYLGREATGKLAAFIGSATVVRGLSVLVVLLLGFQGVQVFRSLEDISTRKYQNADPRVAGVKSAVKTALGLVPADRSGPVRLILISQGMDGEPKNYAQYYARRPTPQNPNAVALNILSQSSWSPEPQNVWQSRADAEGVLEIFSRADIIWPLNLDPWISDVLKRMPGIDRCSGALTESYMINQPGKGFSCLPKPGL